MVRHPACGGRRAVAHRGLAAILLWVVVALVGGCSALSPAPAPNLKQYLITLPEAGAPAVAGGTLVIAVDPPTALPGFQGRGMAYVPRAQELDYFTRNQWVDAPARMLEPLLVQALTQHGSFRAVVTASTGVPADLRLETRIVRLQQEFTARPSRVRFTLRAWLLDGRSRQVLATRVFEAVEPAPGNDPYSGVQAANRAVRQVLKQVVAFCADTARSLRGASSSGPHAK